MWIQLQCVNANQYVCINTKKGYCPTYAGGCLSNHLPNPPMFLFRYLPTYYLYRLVSLFIFVSLCVKKTFFLYSLISFYLIYNFCKWLFFIDLCRRLYLWLWLWLIGCLLFYILVHNRMMKYQRQCHLNLTAYYTKVKDHAASLKLCTAVSCEYHL